MRMNIPLTRGELKDMRSVLLRAQERAERQKRDKDAEELARAVAQIADELGMMG